jgi:hypothetical protein
MNSRRKGKSRSNQKQTQHHHHQEQRQAVAAIITFSSQEAAEEAQAELLLLLLLTADQRGHNDGTLCILAPAPANVHWAHVQQRLLEAEAQQCGS